MDEDILAVLRAYGDYCATDQKCRGVSAWASAKALDGGVFD
jgi:hypothetical protein